MKTYEFMGEIIMECTHKSLEDYEYRARMNKIAGWEKYCVIFGDAEKGPVMAKYIYKGRTVGNG